jgi:serine/threonine-protein kinase
MIRFGPYELDPVLGELRKNGRKLPLPTQAQQVLAMLVERPGQVITRQQIHARLWPNGTIVEFEHGINSSIRRLRAALNDSAEQPRYIETLPKRGYRFIFPCEPSSPPESNEASSRTATEYRILSKLGAGAMGVVYRATDTRLGRDVALKFPIDGIPRSSQVIDAFELEARAAAALNHPNICTVYGLGVQDGQPFIAMELLEGETLDALLQRRQLSLEEVTSIAFQVASALDAAHARGIVHRDIKPANIFVSPGNAVKVVDFGIATGRTAAALANRAPSANDKEFHANCCIAGTMRYMAPEQLEGRGADARSDVFSFGVLLYEMLTHRRPFEGDEPAALAEAIRSSRPRPVTELRSDAPPALARIISKCVAADPSQRWQTAGELLERLQSVEPRRKPRRVTLALFSATAAVLVALVAAASYWRYWNARYIDSLVVLPFANATSDPASEYLADGITEAIINNLSAAPGLRVIARTTAFSFKNKEVDVHAIGRQLGVKAVLAGRISQRGDSIFIQTELMSVSDGAQLWGERFRRSIADVQELQSDISGEIAEKLRVQLASHERERVTRRYTENREAFELYLKAMQVPTGSLDAAGFERRVALLEQAIAMDSRFARAHLQLGHSYQEMGEAHVLPADKSLQKQKEAAVRALELNPELGDAYVLLAVNRYWQDWDWAGAEREFQRALELNAPSAHVEYGRFLALTGRADRALIEARRALEIDPLSTRTIRWVTYIYALTRNYDEALDTAKRSSEGDVMVPFVFEAQGRYDEAIAGFEKLGETAGVRGHLARVYALTGREADARRILRELQERSRRDGVGAYEVAFIYAALGSKDEAFQWLDTAYRLRDSGLKFLKVDSTLDVLRSDPRFQELLRRVGLEPQP